jgi:3-methyladenine DNA glycosylase AlkD
MFKDQKKMKYYVSAPVLDAQIEEIKQKIRLSMNGIASDLMTESGIIYKQNYGVSITRLREIASNYEQNHDLAQRLWSLQIRETMILATLLEPADKFSYEWANQWAENFNQLEIIEQVCMNLLSKVTFSNQLCTEWIFSSTVLIQIAGYYLATRIYKNLNDSELEIIIQKALTTAKTEEFHLYKAAANCLSRFCRKDKKTATFILNETTKFTDSSSNGEQFVLNAVKLEIFFLELL